MHTVALNAMHAGWNPNVYSVEGRRKGDWSAVYGGEGHVVSPYGVTVNPLYSSELSNVDHRPGYAAPEYHVPPDHVYSVMGDDGRPVLVGASNPTYGSAQPSDSLYASRTGKPHGQAYEGAYVDGAYALSEPDYFVPASSTDSPEDGGGAYEDGAAGRAIYHTVRSGFGVQTGPAHGRRASAGRMRAGEYICLDESAL